MPRQLFRLLLLCQLLLFLLHLWMVHRGAVPETPLFREFQGFVWRAIPRWRIFLGLHALVLALSATLVGFILLLALRPSGRTVFAAGLLSYLAYLRLEPRFQAEEWSFILAILSAQLGGVLTVFAISAGSRGAALRGVLGVLLSFLLFRFAREAAPVLAIPYEGELSTFTVFFGAGYLLALSYWGSAAAEFTSIRPSADWTRSRVARGLALHFLAGTVAVALIAGATGASWIWVAVVPFAPLIVAVYAPLSWFRAAGETVVFSSQLVPSFDLALRNRLLLGILFQYLLLGVGWALITSLRVPSKRGAIVAHGSLLLYWLPALWLCQMLHAYGEQ